MKKLITILFLFAAYNGQAQTTGIFGAQLEYSATYKQPGGGLWGGVQLGGSYAGIDTHILFTRLTNVPVTVNIEYGYTLGRDGQGLQPFISYGFYTCGGEAKKEGLGKQGFEYGGGISYKLFNKVRLQVGVTQTNKFISIGVFN